MSIAGESLSVSATARVTAAMSATSTATASQHIPAAVLRAAARSRSQIVMVAPEAASRSAIAKPMPDAPPVTTAWRPLRSSWFMSPPRTRNKSPCRFLIVGKKFAPQATRNAPWRLTILM